MPRSSGCIARCCALEFGQCAKSCGGRPAGHPDIHPETSGKAPDEQRVGMLRTFFALSQPPLLSPRLALVRLAAISVGTTSTDPTEAMPFGASGLPHQPARPPQRSATRGSAVESSSRAQRSLQAEQGPGVERVWNLLSNGREVGFRGQCGAGVKRMQVFLMGTLDVLIYAHIRTD